MELHLSRTKFGPKATTGILTVDGVYECLTLEDRARPLGVKVQDETCIPPGTYTVIINMSQRFGKLMPRILDVPMFDGILIHSGNTDKDTKGCILVGQVADSDERIHGGSIEFPILFDKLSKAMSIQGSILITITNDGELYVD